MPFIFMSISTSNFTNIGVDSAANNAVCRLVVRMLHALGRSFRNILLLSTDIEAPESMRIFAGTVSTNARIKFFGCNECAAVVIRGWP